MFYPSCTAAQITAMKLTWHLAVNKAKEQHKVGDGETRTERSGAEGTPGEEEAGEVNSDRQAVMLHYKALLLLFHKSRHGLGTERLQ